MAKNAKLTIVEVRVAQSQLFILNLTYLQGRENRPGWQHLPQRRPPPRNLCGPYRTCYQRKAH